MSTLNDVADTDIMNMMTNPMVCGYHSGAAGLLGTLEEYGKFAQMYVNGGIYNGVRILKEETVKWMTGEGIPHNSTLLKKLLDQRGIKAELEIGLVGDHGFGDGTDTDVDGWPERAIRFIETL